jgi:hypothetical protein
MTRSFRALVACSLLALGWGCGGQLHVVTVDPSVLRGMAANDFDLGIAAFERGEYSVALEYFNRAFETSPASAVLFDIARAHELMRHDALAAR